MEQEHPTMNICVLGFIFQISIGEDPQRDLAFNGDCFDKL